MQDPADSNEHKATALASISVRFEVGAATDIGRKRSQNQDSFALAADIGLFLVADGMGGHRGGEIASQMATEIVPQMIRGGMASHISSAKDLLRTALRTANHTIYARAVQSPVLQGMGTTTTALLFVGNQLTVGHVGDSRCYYFRRPQSVWQITRDHSLVYEKLRAGLITRAEIRTDRMKNVITRSVGFEPEVNVETYDFRAQPGDTFLMCSDGLTGMVADDEIAEIMTEELLLEGGTQRAVERLIQAANDHGGDDNVTVLVVRYRGGGASPDFGAAGGIR